jgi:hypothetical protein
MPLWKWAYFTPFTVAGGSRSRLVGPKAWVSLAPGSGEEKLAYVLGNFVRTLVAAGVAVDAAADVA